MEFVDYYAILQLPREAKAKQIRKAFLDRLEKEPLADEDYVLAVQAYKVLCNRYKRGRYDRQFGFLLVIQPDPMPYPNATSYRLHSIKPFLTLQHIIERFKAWIEKKYAIDWQEAQAANFSYQLDNAVENPRLVLRFPQKIDQENFALKLLGEKLVQETAR